MAVSKKKHALYIVDCKNVKLKMRRRIVLWEMLHSQKVDTAQSTDYGPKSDPVNGSFAVQHVEQVHPVMWPVSAFSTLA